LTVHVGAIRLLYDFVHEAARKTQVLVTTHCPELLDLLNADDVRVVTRTGGVTAVAKLHRCQVEMVRKHLMTLGEVARTEGLQPDEPDALAVAEN